MVEIVTTAARLYELLGDDLAVAVQIEGFGQMPLDGGVRYKLDGPWPAKYEARSGDVVVFGVGGAIPYRLYQGIVNKQVRYAPTIETRLGKTMVLPPIAYADSCSRERWEMSVAFDGPSSILTEEVYNVIMRQCADDAARAASKR